MPLIGKLKALDVARKMRAGMYGDGGGLYVQVTASGSDSCGTMAARPQG